MFLVETKTYIARLIINTLNFLPRQPHEEWSNKVFGNTSLGNSKILKSDGHKIPAFI